MLTKNRGRRRKRKKQDPALQFTDQDILIVRYYLFHILQSQPRMTTKDLYNVVRDDISYPMTVATFQSVFGLNVKNERIPGYNTKKGKGGGIFLVDKEVAGKDIPDSPPSKAEAPPLIETEEEEEEEVSEEEKLMQNLPDTKFLSSLIALPEEPKVEPPKSYFKSKPDIAITINDIRFDTPLRLCDVNTLVEKVFDGVEDENGKIEYEGKIFTCDNPIFLTKFLFYFFGAAITSTDFEKVIDSWETDRKKKE